MKIKLIDVGRRRYNGEIEISAEEAKDPDAVAEDIYYEVLSKKLLASRSFEVVWDAENGVGRIRAGMHTVGELRVA